MKYIRFTLIQIVLLLFIAGPTTAQLTDWQYRKSIDIQENSGKPLTNYQVLLEVNTQQPISAGKMDAMGDDIRFAADCHGEDTLDYWIEQYWNTDSTQIWVKLDTLPASSTKTIYMFYGNTAADSASDFEATFPDRNIVTTPQTVTTDTWDYDWVEIQSGVSVTLAATHSGRFTINARKIIINGTLNGDGVGYSGGTSTGADGAGPGGQGTGASNTSGGGAGAGYGGRGGDGGYGSSGDSTDAGTGGPVYGSLSADTIMMGSGGGAANANGGNGGAAFQLNARIIELDGTITTKGQKGTDPVLGSAGGGGSGGGIKIKSNVVDFGGILNVEGGEGGGAPIPGGGGAGGRIKIFQDDLAASSLNGAYLTAGGPKGNKTNSGNISAENGDSGTVYTATFISEEPSMVNVTSESEIVYAGFTDSNRCASKLTQFTDTSSGNPASWLWVFGDGDSAFVQNPTHRYNSAGTYTVQLFAGDSIGCMDSTSKNVVIDPLPIANAGGDTIICFKDTVQIGGNPTATGGTPPYGYDWQPNTNINDDSLANPDVWPSNTTSYKLKVTDSKGCSSVDTVQVTVSRDFADAGRDRVICTGDTVQIGANPTGPLGSLYSWMPTDSLSDPTVSNPKAFPGDTVNYSVAVTDTNGCVDRDTMEVAVAPSITADAGQDDTLCLGDTTQLTATGGTEFDWRPATSLSDTAIYNPLAFPATSTDYIVDVRSGSCSDADTVTITVVGNPTADAGADSSICRGDSITLGGSPTASGGTSPYQYHWTPNSGLDDDSVANPSASPANTTGYRLSLIDDNGCSDQDTVMVSVNDNPMADAGSDSLICGGDTIIIGGNPTASGGSAPYTYSWSPTSSMNNSASSNPAVYPFTNTKYTVTVTDDNDCRAMDSVQVATNSSVTADAGTDTAICPGDYVVLGGAPTAIGGTSPYTYNWAPDSSLDNDALPTPTANPKTTTHYTVVVIDSTGCGDLDSVTVSVSDLTVDAGPDQTVCNGSSVQVGGSPTAQGGFTPYNYSWLPGGVVDNPNVANPNASPASDTLLTVMVSDSLGCTSGDSVRVGVNYAPLSDFTFTKDSLTVDFTSNATGASDFQWNFGDGNTDTVEHPTHTYAQADTYLVCLVVANNCGTDTACREVGFASTGLFETGNPGGQVRIYPNPADAYFQITMPSGYTGSAEIQVYNLQGATVHRSEVSGAQAHRVSMAQQEAGIYFVKIMSDDWYTVRRVEIVK